MFKKTSYPTKNNQLIETFDGLFTAVECQHFIDLSEQKGYEAATQSFRAAYRGAQ